MPCSQRQLIANRLNAKKSTGPKTAYGKFRSSRNSLKHGRYSCFDVTSAIPLLPARYQSRLISLLVRGLRSGIIERKFVEQAVIKILERVL